MALVTIYGKPSSTYEYIKTNLSNNLKKAGVDLIFNEIVETQQFIENHIKSIPALKIDDEFMVKGTKKANQFVKDLELKILPLENFGTLKKIIVPFDFADASVNALSYALELAKNNNGTAIKLVHVFRPKPIEAEQSQSIDSLINQRERMLEKIVNDINTDWHLDVGEIHAYYELSVGFAADVLQKTAEENPDALFVMGSSNSNRLVKGTYGSVSTAMAKQSAAPVCIIPQGFKMEELNSIAFCLDDFDLDKEGIEHLNTLYDLEKVKINFIHFNEGRAEQLAEEIKFHMSKNYPKVKFTYTSLVGENKLETIQDFLLESKVDQLVLTRRNRSLIKEFFHNSLTKKLSIESPIPLTVIHK